MSWESPDYVKGKVEYNTLRTPRKMLPITSIHPLRGQVLCRAVYQEFSPGGLLIPSEWQDRFPNIAEVLEIGPGCFEDLLPGDLAIMSTEMFDGFNTYADCFEVVLRDGEENVRILCDLDVEPIFREYMKEYSANPSTEDRWILLQNMEDDLGYKFLASDVLSFGPADLQASSKQDLRYVEARMFSWYDERNVLRLFYLVEERHIQAVIR